MQTNDETTDIAFLTKRFFVVLVVVDYKFAPATALTPQETRIWRQNLIQDEIASNNPFWTARWMTVFGVAPKLDDSLLKVPWIKCERWVIRC